MKIEQVSENEVKITDTHPIEAYPVIDGDPVGFVVLRRAPETPATPGGSSPQAPARTPPELPKSIPVGHLPCPHCDGRGGWVYHDDAEMCQECNGKGHFPCPENPCTTCNGYGVIGDRKNLEDSVLKPCEHCGGTDTEPTPTKEPAEKDEKPKGDVSEPEPAEKQPQETPTEVPFEVSNRLADAGFIPSKNKKGLFYREIMEGDEKIDTVFCNPTLLGHDWKSPYYTSKAIEADKQGLLYEPPEAVKLALENAKNACEGD